MSVETKKEDLEVGCIELRLDPAAKAIGEIHIIIEPCTLLTGLDLLDDFYLWLLQKYYCSAIKTPARILDQNAGNGKWACQLALRHEKATVAGVVTDLEVLAKGLPNRCQLVAGDINQMSWEQKFDLINLRFMPITEKIVVEAFRNLDLGGWCEAHLGIQIVPCCDESLKGSSFKRYLEQFENLSKEQRGLGPSQCVTWMKAAGFRNIRTDAIRRISNHEDDFETVLGFILQQHGAFWDEDLTKLCMEASRGLAREGFNCFFEVHVVVGQKGGGGILQMIRENWLWAMPAIIFGTHCILQVHGQS
ncbi:hypothetical protein BX600DRAFT_515339 [Xylariales sp. PMI_506]|nr:hypothetical protein BX600DRAFT_515339 [Xylariales sp. PMI_506]